MNAHTASILALARDAAIILFVVVYCIHTI
jgi:hypothetical protein